ncbi:ComF family protein [Paenibacillus xylaniclasticus]|uniref:ComF family protein n=1 Tax=Paenibacillus xylaniclasticus TaxID=588083 RepID=UPI000FD74E40|nr:MULTISPECIES: ComF family protein [Paenibacillus]
MIRHLTPILRTAAVQLGGLLSESARPCPLCRTPASGVHLLPEVRITLPKEAVLHDICRDCALGIAWIGPIACVVCGRPDPCGDCIRRDNANFICSRSAVRYNDQVREWLAQFKYRGDERLAQPLADMLDIAWCRLEATLQSRDASHRWDAIIPVPVSAERLAERGFNQAELLAGQLCDRRGLPLYKLLIRTRHSEKKSLQSRHARLKSTKGLFVADEAVMHTFLQDMSARAHRSSVSSEASVNLISRLRLNMQRQRRDRGMSCKPAQGLLRTDRQMSVSQPIRILLIDDIYTTGSTIEACSEAIMTKLQQYAPERNVYVYAITLARS